MADIGNIGIALVGSSLTLPDTTGIAFGRSGALVVTGGQLTAAGLVVSGGFAFVPNNTAAFTGASQYSFDAHVFPDSGGTLTLGKSGSGWGTIYFKDGGVLASGTNSLTFSGAQVYIGLGTVVVNQRFRVTTAEMNAGYTLLAAVAAVKYRLIDIGVITIGGNAAATANATGIAIYGTQTGVVALYGAILAALTRSAFCQPGTANTTILADGASFVANDVNTGITCRAVSAGNYDLITATHFDIILTYAREVV